MARALHPHAPEPWIDLSTGINPRPYPAPRSTSAARARLPEPAALARLEAIAAAAFGVADPARVAAVSGSESVLRLLPYAMRCKDAAIVSPTYSSHAVAWEHSGAITKLIDTTELESAAQGSSVLTLVNPNNPDGAVVSRERLLSLHDRIAEHDGTLIVDEAFVETSPALSVADVAGSECAPHLVVLRSFGKFYGLAGVRLGFVIAAMNTITRIRGLIGEWPIAADAIAVGTAAYADADWAERTRERLQHSARRLDRLLVRNGLQIIGGTSLFRLARSHDARARFQQLLQAGVLTRPFDHDPTVLRFGLPHGKSAWDRLADALRIRR
jgi:cobalamin biosynthesis protein CobC